MKIKKKLKIILIASFMLFAFSTPIFARYYETLQQFTGKATIAEPIIKVEALKDKISMQVNRESTIEEYNFCIKNYINESKGKRINEVDFLYDIEIINSNENFPIKLELYEVGKEKELLNGTSKVSGLEIKKNLEYEKQYKLLAYWESKENMSDENSIDIVIKASQKNN